ncbi:synaptonemal complex protein 1 isoform X4 [Hemicordylus capensis]|uniref:synaptonemal complex protein 1 isoform X4 n=1 Tax=Hemicordylus capensis TaxID=884348 RepID=UPI002303B1C8|nr:synaptonemal complex protein 1 isoform X4 [Hemicordylus capensis]
MFPEPLVGRPQLVVNNAVLLSMLTPSKPSKRMEQEKSFKFKLFVPPRLSNTQVSAVKPQTNTGDGGFFQNFNKETQNGYNLPFGMKNTPKHMEAIDPVSYKAKLVPELDQENMESMNELYSRLYKEAEKIKRWKVSVEYELKEKERKLQENRKIIDALRKAIQELQFENEKLSLKLEDEIHANKDLLKENNATRHLCNLLKEKCMQSMEKSNKYEYEREETREMYMELNTNIEVLQRGQSEGAYDYNGSLPDLKLQRMIQAFEELRVQAENSRLEMYFKLKEEAEKIAQLEKDYQIEMDTMGKQVSMLTMQNGEKDNKMKEISIQLQESRELITELKEIRKQQDEVQKREQNKQQCLLVQLEETKSSLQNAESSCKSLENELQTAVKTLIQVTEQKEMTVEELKETRVLHASVIVEFQTTVSNLKELLEKEEIRQKELRDESDVLILKLQKKSTELEMMAKLRSNKEKQVEEMSRALESAVKVQKDLVHQLENERSEKNLLIKEKETRNSDDSSVQVQVQELLDGKQFLEKAIEKLQEREKELKDTLQIREEKIHGLEMKLSDAFENKQNCSQELATLEAELEKERLRNEQLRTDCNKLLLDNEHITTEKSNILNELKDNRKMGENAKKQIENLKEINIQLRNELESLKVKMKKKDEESNSKLDESEEKVRKTENEISKKEKQLKTLENKNKVLRKKVAAESKQSSITEGKMNTLQSELENINKLYKEKIDSYNKEIEVAKAAEEKLLREVEKMKAVAAEAMAMQKEIDIRCQHKITEMVSLMEKHKHQYDKTVEEKDAELEYYKAKEQELSSAKGSLENELSCKKNELYSLQEQLKTEIEDKESLVREAKKSDISRTEKKHKKTQTSFLETPKASSLESLSVDFKKNMSQNVIPNNVSKLGNTAKTSWTPAKTYTVKTPPKSKLLGECTNLLSEEGTKKKRKVILELDTRSDSSENNDLLSFLSEEEMFKKLYKDCPQTPCRSVMTPKKVQTSSTLKTPGGSVKLAAIRKMREAGWAAVSKMDRRQKMKEAGKLFT